MEDNDFKDKVLAFMARIDEKLIHLVTDVDCNEQHSKLNGKINIVYWGIGIVVGTVGLIAKLKGFI